MPTNFRSGIYRIFLTDFVEEVINPSKPAIQRSAHTLYLCVLCGSENKQRLFPYTTLTDWFL